MKIMAFAAIVALAPVFTSAAYANEEREFCADRPGKGTPPCILSKAQLQIEMSVFDWTRERSGGVETNTSLIGDTLIRVGISNYTEARIGWTPLGIVRTRDLATGARTRDSSIGDITLGFRTSLKNPDGSGLSIALQPSVSLPVGGSAIGSGTWGASLVMPMNVPLSEKFQLSLSPEIDAAPNGSGSGRHLRFGGVAGIGFPLGETLSSGVEIAAFRDDDPAGRTTSATADFTMAWTPAALKGFQIDAGLYAGLNDDTPGLQLVFGMAKRF